MRKQWGLRQVVLLFATFAAVAAVAAYLLAPLLLPLILALALYALLEPASSGLMRRGVSPALAIGVVLAGLVLACTGGVWLLLPRLTRQVARLQGRLPAFWDAISDLGREAELTVRGYGVEVEAGSMMQPLIDAASSWGKAALVQGSNVLLDLAVVLLLVPVFTFFLLRDFSSLRRRLLNLLPNATFEMGWLIYGRVAAQLHAYVFGIMMQSAIMCLVTTAGFAALGMDSPVLLGALAGVFNLIPYAGPVMAMVPALIIALGQVPFDPNLTVAAVSVIVVAQIIDNVVVVPAVVADSVDLHPLVVVTGIIVFGNLMGMMGMIVALPALSTAKIVLTALRGARPV